MAAPFHLAMVTALQMYFGASQFSMQPIVVRHLCPSSSSGPVLILIHRFLLAVVLFIIGVTSIWERARRWDGDEDVR